MLFDIWCVFVREYQLSFDFFNVSQNGEYTIISSISFSSLVFNFMIKYILILEYLRKMEYTCKNDTKIMFEAVGTQV